MGATNSFNERHLNLLSFRLNGDARDEQGVTAWSAEYDSGRVAFDNPGAAAVDAGNAATAGQFHRFTLSGYHLGTMSAVDTLYTAINVQLAQHNLDSSQKLFVGGSSSVRAYDTASGSGDGGYVFNVEWRHALPTEGYGLPVLVGFVDTATVLVNAQPFAPSVNRATFSGAGVGLNWMGLDDLSLKTSIAHPIGGDPATGGVSRSTHAWVELGKVF